VADDEASWQRRRTTYQQWLESDEALLLLAWAGQRAVGYAVVHLVPGPDDTWPVGERYAELYSLSVAPEFRGRGIGGQLMDRVDAELGRLRIRDLQIAVMVGNSDAQRFYERRGFRAGEVVLYRFA